MYQRVGLLILICYISKSEQGFGILRWPGSPNHLQEIIDRYDNKKVKLTLNNQNDDDVYSRRQFGDLSISTILSLGKLCVYHSECSGCDIGYSQRCIANRCQCVATGYQCKSDMKSYMDCVIYHKANAALIYYDQGLQKCIVDKYKDRKSTICYNHHVLTSAVDGETYCLDAVDPFDMICYDNKMCQDVLKTTEFVGLCSNGICHAMSIRNITEFIIRTPSCDSKYLTYCREIDYVFHRVTHSRNAMCSIHCKDTQNTGGVAASYADKCQCFKTSRVEAGHIKKLL